MRTNQTPPVQAPWVIQVPTVPRVALDRVGLADAHLSRQFVEAIRALVENNATRSIDRAAGHFFQTLDNIIEDHCAVAGVARPALQSCVDERVPQQSICFDSINWTLSVNIELLSLHPGSAICGLIAAQLRKAEVVALLIAQQTDLSEAIDAQSILSDAQFSGARKMLMAVCDHPSNRHLLKSIATNSGAAKSVAPLWPGLQMGSVARQLSGSSRIDALLIALGERPAIFNERLKQAYLSPVHAVLSRNAQCMAAHLTDVSANDRIKPVDTHRIVFPPSQNIPFSIPVFYRADEHTEQLTLFLFFAEVNEVRGIDVVIDNLAGELARHRCALELQSVTRSCKHIWVARSVPLPSRPLITGTLLQLTREIVEAATAMDAARHIFLKPFHTGCRLIG
jgi:hypothetical protein